MIFCVSKLYERPFLGFQYFHTERRKDLRHVSTFCCVLFFRYVYHMQFIYIFSDTSPPTNTVERPVSAPIISSSNSELSNDRIKENTSEVTLSLRRPKSNSEDKGTQIRQLNVIVANRCEF